MTQLRLAWFVTVLACVAPACRPAPEESPPQEAAPVRVQVAPVRRGEIADVLDAMGQTEAFSVLRLAAPVAGRVTMLSVRPGDQLAEGTVAARVLPLENEAAVHGFALLERGGALGPAEKEGARKLRDDVAGRDVPLRVPFPAVVAERLHNPGEQVAQNDVLLELFNPHSLYVLAQVAAEAAPRIRAGQAVEVRAAGTHATGQIEAVILAVTPQTLTLPVRIGLTTPLQPPLLHAAVGCRIILEKHTDALLIPRSALISSAAAPTGTVMVAVNDRAERRDVRLGLHTTTDIEVTAGLQLGDLVLTQGQYALPDGTRIEANPPEPSPDERE